MAGRVVTFQNSTKFCGAALSVCPRVRSLWTAVRTVGRRGSLLVETEQDVGVHEVDHLRMVPVDAFSAHCLVRQYDARAAIGFPFLGQLVRQPSNSASLNGGGVSISIA